MNNLSYRDLFYLFRKKIFSSKNKLKIQEIKSSNETNKWIGPYKTWQEVLLDSSGYNSDIILEKCKESLLKVKKGEFAYERDSVLFSEIDYNYELLTALMCAQSNNKEINVLDFGGSLGSSYYQHLSFLKSLDISIKWNIVEQDKFVSCGKEYFETISLRFFKDIKEVDKFNICFLSSVLMYLENPYYLLEQIIEKEVNYIFIDKTLIFHNGEDLLTKQIVPKSIYDAEYPCWIFNKNSLNKLISEKYKLIYEFTPFKGFSISIDGRSANYYGALFKLK